MNILEIKLRAAGSEEQRINLSRFFKTGKGQYGEGDKFLGVKVPVTRALVKQYGAELDLNEIERMLISPYHEIRLAALLTLVQQFKLAKKDETRQKTIIDTYLKHTATINNWDLVDLSCYELLGAWLLDKDRRLLYELAGPRRSLWENRIAIVSTMAFVRKGQLDDTLKIAKILLKHKHDLIHKAVGWLLREVGKRDTELLEDFLLTHIRELPRTTLRYAIEKLPEAMRKALMVA